MLCKTGFQRFPELLTLFTVYNGAALILNRIARFANPDAGFVELSPFVAGVVSLGLVLAAFSAEVLRGGLMGETKTVFAKTFDFSIYLWAALIYLLITTLFVRGWRYLEEILNPHLAGHGAAGLAKPAMGRR